MKVILTDNVKNVGKKGEVVELTDGYARNCIINKKLGIEATPANLNSLKLKTANEEKNAARILAEAKEYAKELAEKTVILSIKCGENGKTFGSVSSKEIVDAAKKQLGLELEKKKVLLKEPIKTPGAFEISVKIHPEVTATFHLQINEER